MTLFLDSARVDDARQSAAPGFVTTKPALVAKALNAEFADP